MFILTGGLGFRGNVLTPPSPLELMTSLDTPPPPPIDDLTTVSGKGAGFSSLGKEPDLNSKRIIVKKTDYWIISDK